MDTQSAPSGPFGRSWQLVSGADPFDLGLDELAYVTFGEENLGGGVLSMFGNDDFSAAPVCLDGVYVAYGDGSARVSAGPIQYGGNERLATFEDTGEQLIVNTSLGSAVFAPVDAVPESAVCGQATLVNDFEIELPVPFSNYDYASGGGRLLFDGTNLLVTGSDLLVYPIATSNGLAGVGFGLDAVYTSAIANEGAAIWAMSDNRTVGLLSPVPTLIDEVSTEDVDSINEPLEIRAAVHDGTHLILHGWSSVTSDWRIQTIDYEAEPDVLLSSVETGVRYRDLTLHDGEVWGLERQITGIALVRVDPATGIASGTVQLPDEIEGSIDSIASDGSSLFVLTRFDGDGFVYEVSMP